MESIQRDMTRYSIDSLTIHTFNIQNGKASAAIIILSYKEKYNVQWH